MGRLGWRGMRANLGRTGLTLAGIALAMAFVCGTQVLAATLGGSLDTLFRDSFGRADVVVRGRYGATNTFAAMAGGASSTVGGDSLARIAGVPGVRAAAGQVLVPTSLVDADGRPLALRGGVATIGTNWIDDPVLGGWHLDAGRPPHGPSDAVLDHDTAADLGVGPGGQVHVVGRDGRVAAFEVVGVARHGTTGSLAGTRVVLTTTAVAQERFLEPGRFNWLVVAGDGRTAPDAVRGRVAGVLALDERAIAGSELVAQADAALGGAARSLEQFVLAFAWVALLVGAYTMGNTLAIVMGQRRRELALLAAVGASRGVLVGAVLVEVTIGAVLAVAAGVVAGVVAALALRAGIGALGYGPFLEDLRLPAAAVAGSAAFGLAVTIGAALVPAWRASGARAVATLRNASLDGVARPGRRAVLVLGLVAWAGWQGGQAWWASGDPGSARTAPITGTAGAVTALLLACLIGGPLLWPRLVRLADLLVRRVGGQPGRLAGLALARHPHRTSRIVGSVVVGVALLAMFAVLATSLVAAGSADIERSLAGDLVVHPAPGGPGVLDEDVRRDVAGVPGVAQAAGVRLTAGEVDNEGMTMIGADPTALAGVVPLVVTAGDLGQIGPGRVAIDATTAARRGWGVGRVVTGEFVQTGYEVLEVVAIIDLDLPFAPGVAVLTTPDEFDRRVPSAIRGDLVVLARPTPGTDAAAVQRAVATVLGDRPFVAVDTVTGFAAGRASVGDLFLTVVSGLLLVALVVVLIGIANALLLAVAERTAEIGALRAVGLQRRQVGRMVRWEAALVGAAGAGAGTVLGIGMGAALAGASARAAGTAEVATVVPWARLGVTAALAVVAAVLAATLPARRAARLDVLVALTHD